LTKQFHPQAARLAGALGDRLVAWLPASGRVLEVASGSGQQAVSLAARFPALTWIPSERDAGALTSIAVWREESRLANMLAPVRLDVRELPWPVEAVDVVLAVRLAHLLGGSELPSLFIGARGAGSRTVIMMGPVAAAPSPPRAPPAHLADWTVPIRIPTREELAGAAAAGGFALAHAAAPMDDELLVFQA
jgi:uncharacterized protein DUF938